MCLAAVVLIIHRWVKVLRLTEQEWGLWWWGDYLAWS